MSRKNLKWVTWVFVALGVTVVALMLLSTLGRPTRITLPSSQSGNEQTMEESEQSKDNLGLVEVTPETVQTAIATLARPENYRRTVAVEQFWNTKSGFYEVTVTAAGPWVRTDRTMPDGRVRHTITGEEDVYIWYNNEKTVYHGQTGEISADNEQTIPTYEEILALPVGEIAAADHQVISGVSCIYVETVKDDYGYVSRYWVSLETGLLAAAERLQAEEVIYHMAGLSVEQSAPVAADFTLPDGTKLLEV